LLPARYRYTVLVSLKMGTGKKLIKNTNERHEAMKLHKVHTNKNRVTRELGETDDNNNDDKD